VTGLPEIRGWCPGALRPMASGDGLVVRLRPPLGRLTAAQAAAIAEASVSHGNGILDLSSRANLQLRGVTDSSHAALIESLRRHDLIDPDIRTETLRNLIVTPFRDPTPKHDPQHQSGESIDALAATLTSALAGLPHLPGKFGFALDCGPRPVLTAASADVRVERAADGRLILRPDGYPLGRPVGDLAAEVRDLVTWFLAAGGVQDGRGRMAALIARGYVPPGCDTAPAAALPQPAPGLCAAGALVALAFGQMQAATLAALASLGHDIRLTPWRMLLLAGAVGLPTLPGLIIDPADPLLRVTACTGAPGCPQARGETRALARRLAPHLPQDLHLHVSGCAKGCAHPVAAHLALVASGAGYDLIRDGKASDTPHLRNLTPAMILDHLKALHAPSL